jgi:hypothetical protein
MKKIKSKDNIVLSLGNYRAKWFIRLWHLISNPFYYLFKGKWRL